MTTTTTTSSTTSNDNYDRYVSTDRPDQQLPFIMQNANFQLGGAKHAVWFC